MLREVPLPVVVVWVTARKMPAFSSSPFWSGRKRARKGEDPDEVLTALLVEALEAIGSFLRRDFAEYAPVLRNDGVLGRTMVARELHLKHKIFVDWGQTPATRQPRTDLPA